jgi:hypothetical protein
MGEKIPVSRLKGLKLVFEDDLYQLAQFILKVQTTQDTPTRKARATVHLVLSYYAQILHTDECRFIPLAKKHGLSLGDTIEPDDPALWADKP